MHFNTQLINGTQTANHSQHTANTQSCVHPVIHSQSYMYTIDTHADGDSPEALMEPPGEVGAASACTFGKVKSNCLLWEFAEVVGGALVAEFLRESGCFQNGDGLRYSFQGGRPSSLIWLSWFRVGVSTDSGNSSSAIWMMLPVCTWPTPASRSFFRTAVSPTRV